MAPKRRPQNVVRSGNAGNSSKSSTTTKNKDGKDKDKDKPNGQGDGSNDGPARPPPLFPVGYKTPLSMLNEKCQKMGWEKPIVDTRPNPGSSPTTFTGSVTLRKRVSKNLYNLDSVRLAPHPPLEIASAAEAKHFAATYAMFRFCSHLPMALVLPPSIRPYWSTLMAEKAAAPDHRSWEWNPDPFAARKEVADRQAKRQEKGKEAARFGEAGPGGGSGSGNGSGRNTPGGSVLGRGTPIGGATGPGGKMWENVPEVRMAPTLREKIEGVVRKMMRRFPSAVIHAAHETGANATNGTSSGTSTPTSLDTQALSDQLTTLGFRPAHVKSALSALESAMNRLSSSSSSSAGMTDPFVLSLTMLSPFEATIEWLLLHLPEDDLPPRYRTSASSSDFVTGASKGGAVKGWMRDKLVKQAGFPPKVVEKVLQQEGISESTAINILGRRLCGWEGEEDGWGVESVEKVEKQGSEDDKDERSRKRAEEVMALESLLDDRFHQISETEFAITILNEPTNDEIKLHVINDDQSPYPSERYTTYPPAFLISSPTVPSYMRLHLHSSLLREFRNGDSGSMRSGLETGQGGAIFEMIEYLEQSLPDILENPPDVGEVTKHLIPPVEDDVADERIRPQKRSNRNNRKDNGRRRRVTEEDHRRVLETQKKMMDDPAYEGMLRDRQKLPAWKERERITGLLDQNRVLVVVGETGCGKSTQLPQFILDHEIASNNGASTNIIVTQPRRVAAMGVASRVAQERMEDIDRPSPGSSGTVGYSIRGERRSGPDTRLLFCTTGIVLRRLGSGDSDLEGVSHVIVDEAHERGVDTDLLICLLRDLLERNKTIKIILMSATINEQIFIKYFGGCPSLSIPGFTYPVTDHYLEDTIPSLDFKAQPARFGPRQTEEQKAAIRADFAKLNLDARSQDSLEILASSDRIDYSLVASIVKHITSTSSDAGAGAILIFMPGVMEIKQCVTELESSNLGSVAILPLHANLSSAEQKRVFLSTAPKRKIVVATNVAETSVTIPDVVYVVDGGKVKETQYDAENGMQKLVEVWTSRASGRQRRGRAGRTQPGHCYKLYTRRTENNSMPRFPVPEILRTPLEALYLQVKAMNEETDVKAFLGKAIDPPKMDAMDAAWTTLRDLGAVETEEQTSKLTALGRHMSMIPVDLRLAKMLVLGTIFRCLDPVLTIAAILSSKPLFTSPMDKREESKKARESFARARSDLLTDVKAYDECMAQRAKGGQSSVRSFCERNFISQSAVRDITSLRQDFLDALLQLGFLRSRSEISAYSVNSSNDNLVKGIIVGGLYPRIARIAMPRAQFEKIQQGTIQKDHEAKEVKMFDQAGRVFIHPSSMLFSETGFKSGYLVYFSKAETSKVFLRDATEVPLYGLLLFGGNITINHFVGGIMLGKDGHVRMKAATRIGVLCSQLRRLLDAQLAEQIDNPEMGGTTNNDEVIKAMMALLVRDGLTQ